MWVVDVSTPGDEKKLRLGVDVGGTKIVSGLVDAKGHLVASHRMVARPEETAKELKGRLLDQLQLLCTDCGAEVTDVEAAGLGFPGDFDPDTGALLTSPNLKRLVGCRPAALFAESFEQRWGFRPHVMADNDTVVAVLGEAHFGAGRGVQRVLYLTVSTGVGGARFDGHQCENLEPGLRLHPLPERPDLSLEELAGGVHLARRARRQLMTWWEEKGAEGVRMHTSVLDDSELVSGSIEERLSRLTARHLGEAAARGNAWCQGLFREAAGLMARGVSDLLDQGWGEERIVVGGSIALRVPGFVDHMRQGLLELQAPPDATEARRCFDPESLVVAGLGEERGILGAVLLVTGDRSPASLFDEE